MLDISQLYEDDDSGNTGQFQFDDDNGHLDLVVNAHPLHLKVNHWRLYQLSL